MKYILVYFSLFFAILASSQPSLQFININSQNGLPSSECYYVMQDSKGYIWISTNKGVVRYDGQEMKVFTREDGLTDNAVFSTYEDARGRIWFRTFNGKISYFFNDSIYAIGANAALEKIIGQRTISKLLVDEKNNLWISLYCVTDLVKIAPGRNFSDITIIDKPEGHAYYTVFPHGDYLFSYTQGIHSDYNLNITDRSEKKVVQIKSLSLGAFSDMINFGDSAFVIGGGYRGQSLRAAFFNNEKMKDIPVQSRITSIVKGGKNLIWLSVYKDGVYQYDLHHPDQPLFHLFNGYTITHVLKDYEGGTWFSTLENGLFYISNMENKRYEYSGEKSATIYRFMKKIQNNLFIGTDEPLLVVIDSAAGNRIVPIEARYKRWLLNNITRFDHKYYLLAYGFVNIYDSKMNKTGAIDYVKDGQQRNTSFRQIFFFNNNKFIFTDGYNISMVENLEVKQRIKLPFKVMSFEYDSVTHEIYAATKAGLFVVNTRSRKPPEYIRLFGDEVIKAIRKNGDDLYVITEQKGIFLKAGNTYKNIFYKKGTLMNDLDVDEYNNVWIASGSGIIFLKRDTEGNFLPQFLTRDDGLQSNEVNHLVWFNHQVWYVTNDGLYYFNPDRIRFLSIPPKIEIEKVEAGGRRQKGNSIVLEYDEDNITVMAKCLSFYPGPGKWLKYRLLGYDSVWQTSVNANPIRYAHLSPGSYTLQIKGVNARHEASLGTKSIYFRVKTPLCHTWWYRAMEAVLGLLVIFVLIKMYVKRVKKKEVERARINNLLAEYQMTALRAQINPHFIFNCISSIQTFVLKNENASAYDYLQKFSKLLRLVLENSKSNFITLEEELAVVNLYIQLEQLRFRNSFRYSENIDERLEPAVISIPYMLLQPVIENAIWHGLMNSDRKEKVLTLSISKVDEGHIEIKVQDNGIGRSASNKFKNESKISMGQKITQERLNLISGPEESKKSMEIIDLTDRDGKPNGTLVKLLIPIHYEPDKGYNSR